MFLYENEKCPVCNETFVEGDDVVVCPKCATPHHRECYNKLGHCANKDKHKGGFEFKRGGNAAAESVTDEIVIEENISVDDVPDTTAYQKEQSTKTVCSKCGAQINRNAPLCYNCGHKQENPDYGAKSRIGSTVVYDDNSEAIDNYRVRDIVAVVKSNTHRFIKKFRTGKKISWNWGAFFFGPYYLFFRKMNLQGIMALVVNVIINLVVRGIYVGQFSAFADAYGNVLSFYMQQREKNANQMPQISPQLMQELTQAANKLIPAILLLAALSLAVNIIIALIADNLYKNRVYQLIKKCDKKSQEISILQSLPFSTDDDVDMSDDGNRATYLSVLGGVSVFAPVAAYCAYNIIMQFINR